MRCAGKGSVQLFAFCAANSQALARMRAHRMPKVSIDAILEYVLQGKLHLSHVGGGGADPAKVRTAQIRIRESPNRVVEEIVRLPAELYFMTLLDPEVLL